VIESRSGVDDALRDWASSRDGLWTVAPKGADSVRLLSEGKSVTDRRWTQGMRARLSRRLR
jgi:hypothetical protein